MWAWGMHHGGQKGDRPAGALHMYCRASTKLTPFYPYRFGHEPFFFLSFILLSSIIESLSPSTFTPPSISPFGATILISLCESNLQGILPPPPLFFEMHSRICPNLIEIPHLGFSFFNLHLRLVIRIV
jgi:hypothetical protein